jgi:hypothetical protein
MNREESLREIQQLETRAHELRAELEELERPAWPPAGYYATFHVLSGMILGFFGASASLLLNVVGSAAIRQHPLELIRVYLTFPLGEAALRMESGLALAVGCGLYLSTGMVYGVTFEIVLTRWFSAAPVLRQFAVTTVMGLSLWLLNYYAVLSWLQPLLFGGAWIVKLIPWWVGALTHLAFAWTMLLIHDWGKFDPSLYGSKQ